MRTHSRLGPWAGPPPGRSVVHALLVVLLGLLAACSVEEEVDPELTSPVDRPFEIVEHEGSRYVVGHGVVVEMQPGWADYEPEKESPDGTTSEWAVGLPAEEGTFPSGLQLSVSTPGEGLDIDTLPDTARGFAEQAPGYEFLDEGEADVPGAQEATYLRFLRDLEYDGEQVRLEQVTLLVAVTDDSTATIRFLAPQGHWEEQMQDAYDSVAVALPEDS